MSSLFRAKNSYKDTMSRFEDTKTFSNTNFGYGYGEISSINILPILSIIFDNVDYTKLLTEFSHVKLGTFNIYMGNKFDKYYINISDMDDNLLLSSYVDMKKFTLLLFYLDYLS